MHSILVQFGQPSSTKAARMPYALAGSSQASRQDAGLGVGIHEVDVVGTAQQGAEIGLPGDFGLAEVHPHVKAVRGANTAHAASAAYLLPTWARIQRTSSLPPA